MPTYLYKCHACDVDREEPRPVAYRDQAPTCPICGRSMRRQQVAATPIFKGDGWTDAGKAPRKESS